MNLRTVNDFFSYLLFGVGTFKLIHALMVFSQTFTNVSLIFSGKESTNMDYLSTFSVILGGIQIFLFIASIIMICINSTKCPSAILGYLWGMGAFLLEFIVPNFLLVYALTAECGLYMKGGFKLKYGNENYKEKFKPKPSKQTIKNTEWFYKNPQKSIVEQQKIERSNLKNQQKIEKIEKELVEWKQLLDSGEVDEESYIAETNRLIEKENKLKGEIT